MENQHRMIRGYRELEQGEIDAMNRIKQQGAALEELLLEVGEEIELDGRWASIAKTHFQQGLMALTRAVAKPSFF